MRCLLRAWEGRTLAQGQARRLEAKHGRGVLISWFRAWIDGHRFALRGNAVSRRAQEIVKRREGGIVRCVLWEWSRGCAAVGKAQVVNACQMRDAAVARAGQLDTDLVERDAKLSSLEVDLRERDAKAVLLVSRLEEAWSAASIKDTRIAGLEADLDERDAKLSSLESAASERDARAGSRIAELEADVASRMERIGVLEGMVSCMEVLEVAVQEKDAVVKGLEAAVWEKDAAIRNLDGQVSQQTGKIERIEEELSAKMVRANELEGQVSVLTKSTREMEARIEELECEVAVGAERIAEMQHVAVERDAADEEVRLEAEGREREEKEREGREEMVRMEERREREEAHSKRVLSARLVRECVRQWMVIARGAGGTKLWIGNASNMILKHGGSQILEPFLVIFIQHSQCMNVIVHHSASMTRILSTKPKRFSTASGRLLRSLLHAWHAAARAPLLASMRLITSSYAAWRRGATLSGRIRDFQGGRDQKRAASCMRRWANLLTVRGLRSGQRLSEWLQGRGKRYSVTAALAGWVDAHRSKVGARLWRRRVSHREARRRERNLALASLSAWSRMGKLRRARIKAIVLCAFRRMSVSLRVW